MADKARREVTLQLGAENYVLTPSFASVCGVEERISSNLFEFGRRIEVAQISAVELIDFAHACIAEAGYKVTRERLAELIVEAGTATVLAPLTEYCRIYIFGARRESDVVAAETGDPNAPDSHPDSVQPNVRSEVRVNARGTRRERRDFAT